MGNEHSRQGRVRLLIDSVNRGGPGTVHLQKELALAADAACPVDCDIVLLQSTNMPSFPTSSRTTVVRIDNPGSQLWNRWRWYYYDLPKLIRRYRADVIYSLSGILSSSISRRCATIATINNMVPFTPEQLKFIPILSRQRMRLWILRKQYCASARYADTMLLHSRHAMDKVSSYAGNIEPKTTIVYTGMPSAIEFHQGCPPSHPYGGKPYLLFLSAIYWYKNHLALIEAYRRKIVEGVDLPDLILAGFPEDKIYLEKIRESIGAAKIENRVKYIGTLPSADLGAWLHHAIVNVFPSTCETNSVVLAEILGVHGVLACSNIPPMPEICGNASEYFDPYDPDSIGATVAMLCAKPDLRAELRQRAAERSQSFSWYACGEALWKLVPIAIANFQLKSESLPFRPKASEKQEG